VIYIALAAGLVALLDALLKVAQSWLAITIGESLIFDLRTRVFRHVQKQPLAFFMRTETGALVSRLNNDIVEAQQAVTSTLASVLSSALSLIVILATMYYLSWVVALAGTLVLPVLLLPARLLGRRISLLTRAEMESDAQMTSTMTEHFNVAGALVGKIFGRPSREARIFAQRAAKVKRIVILKTIYGSSFSVALTLMATLAVALVYGLGGWLVVGGQFRLGTLVALVSLLLRTYAPITALSGAQVNVLTSLVAFDRVTEVLELEPLITDRPGASALRVSWSGGASPGNGQAPPADIEFENVYFHYPTAAEVSLASLEPIALSENSDETLENVLEGLSFCARAGGMTALVGPSGAGKTTIGYLACRLYDPDRGVVRIAGQDLEMVTMDSLRDAVGAVTQETHLFHNTVRANLEFAPPGASDADLIEACKLAQVWDVVKDLPDGLDTVVGESGYRLSGGEKQRLALARLILKAPPVVVLDEATSNLDAESEAAVQEALQTALSGRTSLVIAHRLSTVRQADQILLIEAGRVAERGTHDELLERGGRYADLYRTQFAVQEKATLF
jgi:ATP-binding cassette subfamily B protein